MANMTAGSAGNGSVVRSLKRITSFVPLKLNFVLNGTRLNKMFASAAKATPLLSQMLLTENAESLYC